MPLSLETLMSIKDWLTYSGGPDRPGELCYNFSISNDLTPMVNFATWTPDCNSHSPALLDLFISSDACSSTTAFPPSGNSDRIVCSISIDVPWNSQWNALFHCITYTILVLIGMVFLIIWEMFYGRVSLNSNLLLLLVNFLSGFRLELIYISLIVSIRSSLFHLHGFQLLLLLT